MRTDTMHQVMNPWETIMKEILSWPGVIEKASEYGSPHGYYVNEKGFCHFHGENQLDVRLSKEAQEKFKQGKRVAQNHYTNKNILVDFKTGKDIPFALQVVRRAYEEARK